MAGHDGRIVCDRHRVQAACLVTSLVRDALGNASAPGRSGMAAGALDSSLPRDAANLPRRAHAVHAAVREVAPGRRHRCTCPHTQPAS
jgi:hypothetical protein